MVEPSRGPSFAKEAATALGVECSGASQELQCDLSVVGVVGPPDLAHAPFAQSLYQRIRTDALGGARDTTGHDTFEKRLLEVRGDSVVFGARGELNLTRSVREHARA